MTDERGGYVFEFLELGNYVVEASDAAGNRGRSQVDLTATGQTAVADIAFLGKATVTGVVMNPANAPVVGAAVELNGRGIFGGRHTATTNAEGVYTIPDVFIGAFDVVARAEMNRLGGRASGEIQQDGQTVTANITLVASGNITGTVFRRDGTTPAPNVEIRLSPTGLTATTNAQGAFSFNALPIETYTLIARETATGDQGRGTATIATQDETVNVNINLNGQSRVIVTVRDGANNTVAGARVTLNSDANGFTATQTSTTGADGTAVFARVLIGNVTATASDFMTRLSGTTTSTVAPDTDTNITVGLQATGIIAGTIRAVNGAPVGGIFRVRLNGQVFRETTNTASGAFRFEMIPTNTYTVQVLDNLNNVRAQANNVTVTRQDETVNITLDLTGTGTVNGIVTNEDGTPASRITVFLDSAVAGFNRFSTTTDINGAYSFTGVPVGNFTAGVNFFFDGQTVAGSTAGTITADGATATANIALTNSSASRNNIDFNGFAFDIRRDLSIGSGTNNFFLTGNANATGGALLDIIVDNTSFRFNPTANSTLEASGRQYAARQTLAGLDITRHIFFTDNRYFVRYTETVSNPTGAPVTVAVRVTSNARFINKVQNGNTFAREPRVVLTSSGDASVDVTNPSTPDRWVVVDDDEDLDPFIVRNNLPGVAHIFDGANATVNSGNASFNIDFTNRFGQLVHEWRSVTLAPGETASFLHFISQQTDRAAAQASAERLVQLPPEALEGLNAQDAANIRNFAVQLDSSSVAPLPNLLNGSVNGFVVGADGSTVVPNARVNFQSSNPIFHRVYSITANAQGLFTFSTRRNINDLITIPVAPFMLQATHPQSGIVAIANGSFSENATQAATNIVFGNSGIIAGIVRRATGVVVSSGTVRISGATLNNALQVSIAADGSYRATGLPAGSYTVTATTNGLTGTTTVSVTEGEVSTADITVEATGIVTGIVRRANNNIVVGARVFLRLASGVVRQATTDTSGRFTFIDVPLGAASLDVFDAASNTAASASVTVTADITVTQNLTLIAGGIVNGLVVNSGNNAPVAGAQVTLFTVGGTLTTTTGSDGRYEVARVLQGNVVVQVIDNATGLRGRSSGGIGQSGSTLTLNVTLAAVGTLNGIVRRNDGVTIVAGAQVGINRQLAGLPTTTTTDAQGRYSFDYVPLGDFTVTASDAGGDRGDATGRINTINETQNLDIVMNGLGRVVVTVLDASGSPLGNASVTLNSLTRFGGSFNGRTQPDGTIAFEAVLAGNFNVTATNPANTLSRTVNGTVARGATTQISIQLGRGTVTGRITDPNNQFVAGAQITLTAADGTFTTTSAADGTYSFNAVGLGDFSISAQNAANTLRGRASGTISFSGQTLTRDIRLSASGTVTGTIFRADGTTPVAGILVTLTNNSVSPAFTAQTLTNANGRYTFEQVPVGSFTLEANEPSSGDRGRTTNQLTASGETRTVNFNLIGVGRVVVTVRDSADAIVSGAQVTLTGNTQFSGSQTATTGTDGTATFERVLAGNFSVSALNPANNLRGSASGTLAPSGTANVSVQLQPSGTLAGRVFAPDGTTPVSGSRLRLISGATGRVLEATSAEDGSYRFEILTLGLYTLEAYDSNNRLRQRVSNVNLSTNGETVTRDVTFIGLGTVIGRVTNPDGTAAANAFITVRSANPIIASVSVNTNAQGDYTAANVSVGNFTVTGSNPNGQLRGEVTGQIATDGETVTANVQLSSNTIVIGNETRYLDANRFEFTVFPNGSLPGGTNSAYFGNNQNFGGFLLDIVANGSANRFTGSSVGTPEENRREVAIQQQNLAGLNVTRKVFVPADGYFVRYLETLTNPTANPITVDLRVTSNIRSFNGTNIVSTSSGDSALNIDGSTNQDRWVVIDDGSDADPIFTSTLPGLGFVFDGQGATERIDAGEYVGVSPRRFSHSWNAVRLEPNQSVTFMHFGVQQTTRAAARASAERLVQLPPEAIADLTDAEIGLIRNFAVPANRTSPLAPFNFNGTVTGRTLEADNTPIAAGARVTFRSDNPIFSRAYTLETSGNNPFTFTTGRVDVSGFIGIIVPVEGFTLTATHGQTGVSAPTVAASFAPGETTVTRDIIFSNTGIVTGTVRRHTGALVTGGFISITGAGLNINATIASDGSFRISGVPVGNNYSLRAAISRPQGSDLAAVITLPNVASGQTINVDVTLPATGTITGIVTNADGTVAVGADVRLIAQPGNAVSSQTRTDNTGRYTFTDVQEGAYQVSASDRITFVAATAQINVARDATTTQNIALIGFGQVSVQVNFANGTPAANSFVFVDFNGNRTGRTDSSGRVTIPNVPVGDFTVSASHPTITYLLTRIASRINTNGETVAVTITLPGVGSVTGRVTRPNGSPSANTSVEIELVLPNGNAEFEFATTDSNGNFTFAQIPANVRFTIRAFDEEFNTQREITDNIIPSDGATLTINLVLPAIANLRVTVRNPDGTPYNNAAIYLTDGRTVGVNSVINRKGKKNATPQSHFSPLRFVGNTDADGVLVITGVPEGAFTIEARNPNSDVVVGTASGNVLLANDNQTVDVLITTTGLRTGIVEGRIVAADNQTPVPFAFIEIFDVSNGQRLAETFGNDVGEYRFTGVAPRTNDGFRVVAHEVNDLAITAESSASFPTDNATVSVNLTLATSIIKGFVFFAGGTTPVERLSVSATQTINGNTRNYFAFKTGSDGSYVLTGVRVGDFILTAQDNDTGLKGTASGRLDNIAVPLNLNVTLPLGGVVTGRVLDYSGNPVPNNPVSLRPDNFASERFTVTDAAGVYRFERVPIEGFTVFSQLGDINGSASSRVINSGDTVTLDITFPPRGTINGRIFAPDGTTPVAFATILIRNFGNIGVGGRTFLITVTANADGRYSVNDVPIGNIRVTASDPNPPRLGGTASGILTTDAPLTLDITIGMDFVFTNGIFNLDGTDNFRYDVSSDGALSDGGTIDRNLSDAYDGAYFLVLDRDATFNNVDAGRIEVDGRQIVLESSLANLEVKRKIFSPVAGKFARYLEVITNNSDTERTVNVDIQSNLGSDSRTRIVVSPDENDFRFAVTDQGGRCCDPALAHVFNGSGARVGISGLSFNNGNDSISYSWNVRVPAGQTIILMHFAVQRATEDTGGARSQAEALSDLSETDALVGMSDEEKSQVVNFNLAPASITQPRVSPSKVKRSLRPSPR